MSVHTWTVDEVCTGVRSALEATFPDEFWVRGEIQGLRKAPAGHVYFDLIEPGATGRGQDSRLSTVAFRGPLRGIEALLRKVGNLELHDGIEVRVRGKVGFYPPQGRVQFMMSAIDPRHTLGQISADRDRVMRALLSDGLLDRNATVPMAAVPLRVGLVTSHDSAAYNDFIQELTQSRFAFEVTFVDARVQGAAAEDTLVAALEVLRQRAVDVIAVIRGGGAKGDLLAFDRESVARAIATSPVPVLVGIGHEIDRAVADEVAHSSLKTPTACAAALVGRVNAFMQRLSDIAATTAPQAERSIRSRTERLTSDIARLQRATTTTLTLRQRTLDNTRNAINTASRSAVSRADHEVVDTATRVATSSKLLLAEAEREVVRVSTQLPANAARAIGSATTRLDAASTLVRAVHPDRTLARGYTITRDGSGRAIVAASAVMIGDMMVTSMIDGSVESAVTNSTPTPLPTARKPRTGNEDD